jgi:GTP-binding protein Era
LQITTNNSNQNNKKFGFVSLIGETNSGKSTLVNQLVGKKVSQISHKVQFTRGKILGIYTKENYQIAFVDTPGIFTPKKLLDKSMVKLAYREINDSDSILFVLDSQKGITNFTESLIEKFKNLNKDIYLVLNKVDLVDKSILLKISNDLNSLYNFKFTFMISALTGKGVNDILLQIPQSLN